MHSKREDLETANAFYQASCRDSSVLSRGSDGMYQYPSLGLLLAGQLASQFECSNAEDNLRAIPDDQHASPLYVSKRPSPPNDLAVSPRLRASPQHPRLRVSAYDLTAPKHRPSVPTNIGPHYMTPLFKTLCRPCAEALFQQHTADAERGSKSAHWRHQRQPHTHCTYRAICCVVQRSNSIIPSYGGENQQLSAGPEQAHLLSLTVPGPSAESTPYTEKRGASSAIWGSMPKSSMLEITCDHA